MRHTVSIALASALVATPLAAQNVLTTPDAKIEIIGLKTWTVKMIEDSLAKYAPNDKLTVHACAAILQEKLHFAGASVNVYMSFPEYDFKKYVAITVVEPSDSARIHHKAWKFDSIPPRAEWAAAYAVLRANDELTQRALQTASFFNERLTAADSTKFAKLDALHRLIVGSRGAADYDNAIRTIENDSVMANRIMAAILLSSFADRDGAWWALVDAQRDPTRVSSHASMSLRTMTKVAPRVVDWRPMADRLRYIIDGTNLFAFNQTLSTLVATGVSPSLAQSLLGDGGTLVMAKLRSGDIFSRREATAFLAQLSGLPTTSDADTFERWMNGLQRRAAR
jgi:hypothetical protein